MNRTYPDQARFLHAAVAWRVKRPDDSSMGGKDLVFGLLGRKENRRYYAGRPDRDQMSKVIQGRLCHRKGAKSQPYALSVNRQPPIFTPGDMPQVSAASCLGLSLITDSHSIQPASGSTGGRIT